MIIFHNKDNGEVYGTQEGYIDDPDFWIVPRDVDKEKVGKIMLEREWEKEHPDIVETITLKRVKNADKLEFEDDIRKTNPPASKEGTKPCGQMLLRYKEEIEKLKAEVVELKEKKIKDVSIK